MLDALTFALFGKPFRKINKPQLMNTSNNRDMVTEIEFRIGSRNYKIIRGLKPVIFEIYINGELLNQQAAMKDQQEYLEKNILKLNFKTFTQIVILGSSSFVPFMQLPAGHRREVIEDLLDIEIFSRMNVVLKQKVADLKDQITQNENSIALTEEKVKLQKEYINNLKNDNEKKKKEYEQVISDTQEEIDSLESKTTEVQQQVEKLGESTNNFREVETRLEKANEIDFDLKQKIKQAKKEKKFYAENDNCPSCKQEIQAEFKQEIIDTNDSKIAELDKANKELQGKITELEEKLNERQEILDEINALQKNISEYNIEISSKNRFIGQVQKQIQSLSTNDDTGVQPEQEKLQTLVEEGTGLMKTKSVLSEEREVMNLAAMMLKDSGIKTKIIKQYVPIINKLVNKYLASMDFYINFELDENFSETINSRYRNEFSYASFSEGEKMRIDLSLLFTWRSVAKLKNSVSTNLLILDEVFDSSLDGNGTEDFMKILRAFGEETNVFVISHKGDVLQDRFNDVIRFEKKGNYSKMVA